VAKAVAKFPRLRQLHLHNNDLKDEGVRVVVQALAARAASQGAAEEGGLPLDPIQVLNLSENGMESVESLLEFPIVGLRELRLADNLDLEEGVDDDQKEQLGDMYPVVVWEAVEEAFDVSGAGAGALEAAAEKDASDDEALARALDSVHL
jgi:hypothetical protein